MPILSDRNSEIIRAFGVLDTGVAKGSFAYGIARPITFLVDPDGVIQKRFSADNYRENPPAGDVLEAIRKAF